MNSQSHSRFTTFVLPILMAVALVALSVAATKFGVYLECSGAG